MEQSFGRQPEPGSDRAFGVVVGTAFAILAIRGAVLAWPAAAVRALGGGGAMLLLLGLLRPIVLAPLNRLWFRFGLALGRVTAPVVMGVVFTLTVVPTGALIRLLGKDPLGRRVRRAESFWVARQAGTSFREQF